MVQVRPMEIDFLVRVSARMDHYCRVKIFHRRRLFFPTTKHPKVTRLEFDRAQGFYAPTVIVIWFSLSIPGQFWLSEDMPVLCIYWTRFRVINFRLLYLKKLWQKTKVYENPAPIFVFWLTRTKICTSSGLMLKMHFNSSEHSSPSNKE